MRPLEVAVKKMGGNKALAEAIGVSSQLISLMLRNKTPVSAEQAMLIQLATEHEVKAWELRPDLPWGAVSTDREKFQRPAPKTFGPQSMQEIQEDLAVAYIKHRKAVKAPLSEVAWRQIVKEADKAGWSVSDAVTEGIARGWRSFKAEWVKKQGQGYTGSAFGDYIEGECSEPERLSDLR